MAAIGSPDAAPRPALLDDDATDQLRTQLEHTKTPFRCAFEKGEVVVCPFFRQGFQGRGAERYESGEIYVGEFMAGDRHGSGSLRYPNGQMLISRWKDNSPVGEGVQWSTDHTKAARLNNGVPVGSLPLREAADMCASVGLPVPSEWYVGDGL